MKKRVFTFLSYFLLIFGFLLLLYALVQIPYIQTHTPVGRYQKAYSIYKYAKTFPAGSEQYNKFMTIARAYFYNQKSFPLSGGNVPGMPPQPPTLSPTPTSQETK